MESFCIKKKTHFHDASSFSIYFCFCLPQLLKNIENKDRREEDVTDFLFAMFDHNNDGFIDSGEMHFLFKEMGATSTERKQILRYIDRDRDNRLNKDGN